jgi:hypothetical protein
MDSIRANSHAVWNRIWYLLQTRTRQEIDSIRANSHAVFETGFDICCKPELDKKWILSGLTVMQCENGFDICYKTELDKKLSL